MFHQSHQPITGTILVADDQAANRELLEELLTAQGCKVIIVPDGAAAVKELARTQVDLVLLDVMMPRLNGFEACEKIKTSPDTYLIPVIMITALSDKQDRLEGIKVGADDFLSRPVDRTELLARVQSLLKLKQRTDELERAESVLFSLARSIEGKDPYTHGHCERLAQYSAPARRASQAFRGSTDCTPSRWSCARCGENCRAGRDSFEARTSHRRGMDLDQGASHGG